MKARIVHLLRMDLTLGFPCRATTILLLIAGAAAGLIARGVARAQTSKPEQNTSTKELVFDAHFGQYKQWLDQDVRWIIMPEERQAFLGLSNDRERDEFIRQFWVRRNPNPENAENKFKEEHYRRLAFANTHFAAGEPGWETDRGHVYIVFGPPDSIDSHSAAGNGATRPFEIWHYRSIRLGSSPDLESDANRHTAQVEIVKDFDFKFVDECACGQYRLESPWPLAESGIPASDPAAI